MAEGGFFSYEDPYAAYQLDHDEDDDAEEEFNKTDYDSDTGHQFQSADASPQGSITQLLGPGAASTLYYGGEQIEMQMKCNDDA